MPYRCAKSTAVLGPQSRSNLSPPIVSQNGNICGQSRRLSAKGTSKSSNWMSGDEIEYGKSRDFRPIPTSLGETGGTRVNEWLGRGDSNLDMANSKSDALACPKGAAEPRFVKIHKPLETFEFREPYRLRRVQSFGEKWAFRRRMSRPCRLEVRSSNEKSLLPLGPIANKFAQRINGFGQAGGGRETGIQPSPRKSAWRKLIQRTAASGLSLPRRRLQVDSDGQSA
jgi:hypothetical protein